MSLVKTTGLVIKQTNVGDYDRILTVFTENLGKITIMAKGARSMKRNILSSARTFAFSEFVLYEGKNIYSLSQCCPIELFFGLSQSLDALEAAAYICRFLDFIVQAHETNEQLLRLSLNCLHVLNKGKVEPSVALSVFRLRALCITGFEPVLDGCAVCGTENQVTTFSVSHGGTTCKNCLPKSELIDPDLLQAMKFFATTPLEKIFSFKITENLSNKLQKLTESFLEYHTDFKSL